jgi:hypothetical protein
MSKNLRQTAAALLRIPVVRSIYRLMLVSRLRSFLHRPLDAELAELIETVWAAEAMWRLEDRVEASIRYGTKASDSR